MDSDHSITPDSSNTIMKIEILASRIWIVEKKPISL